MKKFLKWTGIVLAVLIILLIAFVIWVFISHDRYQLSYNSGGKLDTVQAAMDIISYDLALEIFPEEEALRGVVTVSFRSITDSLDKLEFDLIDNFDVSEVKDTEGRNLEFEHDDGKLVIGWPGVLSKNTREKVSIKYAGQPLEAIYSPWLGGFNWSVDSTGSFWIGVACQSEGADIWFPCKDNPSDKPDSAALHITIPEGYFCAANGLLDSVMHPVEGKVTYNWSTHYPISNYNINISIGKYETLERSYQTTAGTVMPVRYYVLQQSLDRADELLDMAVDMLTTYRKFYGEYPFIREKFAIVQTNYLGMEHQTINAYGNNYHFMNIDGLVFDQLMLHEMGHEWWGNKVTAKHHADMWIQEGICTYGEALYVEDKLGSEAYHHYMNKIRKRISNRSPVIPDREASENDVYQGDIYYKGAQLMHSLRFMMGDSAFFRMLKTFATDSLYTYKNMVTTDDFIALVNKISARDYQPYIDMFLYTTEIPKVKIDSLGSDNYRIGIPNIDYTLSMEILLGDSLIRTDIGSESSVFKSPGRPEIDPNRWYYLTTVYFK
jgi:aminopeptidase N